MSVPSSTSDDLTPFAPRTPNIIGRKKYIDAIYQAINDDSGQSNALYFFGHGGIGKTRILEEVENIRQKIKTRTRCSGIIDLYHAEHLSSTGLRQAIVDGLDNPKKQYFRTYRRLYREFERKKKKGISGPELETLHQQLDEAFQQDYIALAEKQRLILCIDTLEQLQYENESDPVQQICQIKNIEAVVKDWFLEQVNYFRNTVILCAGRPSSEIQDAFAQTFQQAGFTTDFFNVGVFEEDEIQRYLDALSEQHSDLVLIVTPEIRETIGQITQGRPIYLTILIDLLLHGETLGKIFPVGNGISQGNNEVSVGEILIRHLLTMPEPFGPIISFLVHARKGLDTGLLQYLLSSHQMGSSWSENELQAMLSRIREFAFVKTRPGFRIDGQSKLGPLFLHDEVYDLFDRYLRNDPDYANEFQFIAQYYRQQLSKVSSILAYEDLTVTLLYYELQVNVRTGYYKYYARWDDETIYHEQYNRWSEEAIKSQETVFDIRLRDEVLRFLNRYTTEFYDPRVANLINRADIDRDSAVRWITRYLAHGDSELARQTAESLYNSKHYIFDWNVVTDPLYKAGLLTALGETMLYTGEAGENTRLRLEQAIKLLENYQMQDDDQSWWRARIMGRAYNNLGYLYWTQGRYGLASQEFRRAISHFTEADTPNDLADSWNNLAFLEALMGATKDAQRHVDKALRVRQRIGRRYPIALSHNTLGIIYSLEDHPIWGERECREALKICKELQNLRGIGLAYNGIGFALRRRSDQWKLNVYSFEEAEKYFQEAPQYFLQAVDIFSNQVPEPFRVWEAYNELGSLYCDWGWLTRHRQEDNMGALEKIALGQYIQSIEYQKRALEIAAKHDLQFQLIDSYDDLAQVYGDQTFLLAQMKEVDAARQSLDIATSYLMQVEKIVPEVFHLLPGGFRETVGEGEAFCLALGKVHLWQGIWTFRDLKANIRPNKVVEEAQQQANQHFLFAIAYFQHFWPNSFPLERTFQYLSTFLESVGSSAKWAHNQVKVFRDEFRVSLAGVDKIIDDTLVL